MEIKNMKTILMIALLAVIIPLGVIKSRKTVTPTEKNERLAMEVNSNGAGHTSNPPNSPHVSDSGNSTIEVASRTRCSYTGPLSVIIKTGKDDPFLIEIPEVDVKDKAVSEFWGAKYGKTYAYDKALTQFDKTVPTKLSYAKDGAIYASMPTQDNALPVVFRTDGEVSRDWRCITDESHELCEYEGFNYQVPMKTYPEGFTGDPNYQTLYEAQCSGKLASPGQPQKSSKKYREAMRVDIEGTGQVVLIYNLDPFVTVSAVKSIIQQMIGIPSHDIPSHDGYQLRMGDNVLQDDKRLATEVGMDQSVFVPQTNTATQTSTAPSFVFRAITGPSVSSLQTLSNVQQ